MMRIVTLCPDCREQYSEGYSVKPYAMKNAKTTLRPACESCGVRGRSLQMFIVDRKRK